MLAEKVDEITNGKDSRVAVVRDVKIKRKSSAAKKSKRKYRALDEAKTGQDAEGKDVVEEINGSRDEPSS